MRGRVRERGREKKSERKYCLPEAGGGGEEGRQGWTETEDTGGRK